jgi:hypothetical protein
MKRALLAMACLFVLIGIAGPALAACPAPYPYSQYVTCEVGTCSGGTPAPFCWGGLQNGDTCGAPPCSTPITCCGSVVGYETVPCNSLCAGCRPDAKKLAKGTNPGTEVAIRAAAKLRAGGSKMGSSSTPKGAAASKRLAAANGNGSR